MWWQDICCVHTQRLCQFHRDIWQLYEHAPKHLPLSWHDPSHQEPFLTNKQKTQLLPAFLSNSLTLLVDSLCPCWDFWRYHLPHCEMDHALDHILHLVHWSVLHCVCTGEAMQAWFQSRDQITGREETHAHHHHLPHLWFVHPSFHLQDIQTEWRVSHTVPRLLVCVCSEDNLHKPRCAKLSN